jgi:hypothetical protein
MMLPYFAGLVLAPAVSTTMLGCHTDDAKCSAREEPHNIGCHFVVVEDTPQIEDYKASPEIRIGWHKAHVWWPRTYNMVVEIICGKLQITNVRRQRSDANEILSIPETFSPPHRHTASDLA